MKKVLKKISDNGQLEGYEKIDLYNYKNVDQLSKHYAAILKLIGENPNREGLQKTPERVAKSIQYLTHGYLVDPVEILNSAKFKDNYREMVIVKDI